MANHSISDAEVSQIIAMHAAGETKTTIARKLGRSRSTISEYIAKSGDSAPAILPATLPDPVPESGGPRLPDPVRDEYKPYNLNVVGKVLILSDVHLPHHDKRTIESAIDEGRRQGVAAVILNGDILDCAELSTHEKSPSESRLEEEIEVASQFFTYIRSRFPNAKILYREGNHEQRLPRYLTRCAPAIVGSKWVTLPRLLELEKYGFEWVGDSRVVQLGKLAVLHGHEYRGSGGVSPARWLFLRAISDVLSGHFHRVDEWYDHGLDGRLHGSWSVGCACYLSPRWMPLNKWVNGYAIVDVCADGSFAVTNRKILRDGRVV